MSYVSSFKSTTSFQSKNWKKSVLSRLSHPPEVKFTKNLSLQDHHTLPKRKLPKTMSLQGNHILPMGKLQNMSPFKTSTLSQSRNCPTSLLSWLQHPPLVEIIQNSPYMTPQHPKVKITQSFWFQDHHNLPKCKLLKISPFKTPHPPKTKIIQIQPL